ncbi:MAG: FtsW/RodA/SpoVE family cell cycle protein, partial [Acidimicrobiales bacterium]|nr:FtsW/RodA/SpoVE family cell cycle protein [Acidimicrobiales bacterium]
MAATYGSTSGRRHRARQPLTNWRSNPASPSRHIDLVLVGAVFAVSMLGAVMVYSTTRGATEPYDRSYLVRVLMFIVLGGAMMGALAMFDYRKLRDFWPFVYGGSVLLLLLVLIPGIGSRTKGTQGWFQLPGFQLQPSELAKLGMIIGFAGLASQFRGDLDNARVVMLLGICGAPMALVLLQPDLGTTLVSVAVTFALLLVAGVPGRILGGLAVAAILGTTVVLTSGLLKEYQVNRLTTYVRQDEAATTDSDEQARFNLDQSKAAIGNGGLWGQGLFEGKQTNGRFVPEQRTDFIFSAVGEQLGFVGSSMLLLALGVIVWRVWRTAQL